MLPISIDTKDLSIIKMSKTVTDWERQALVENEIIMMNDFFFKTRKPFLIQAATRMELHYDNLKTMQAQYRGETIHYDGYLDRIEDHQIFCFEGKLYDHNGELITTEPLDFNTGAILVMNEDGVLFLSHKKRGEIHHSTFLAAGSVAYAGMLEIQDGVIVKEEVWSGHYTPTDEQQRQFKDRLSRNFVFAYDKNCIPIFLALPNNSYDDNVCIISRKPLFEPVILQCNHIFNRRSLEKWFKVHQYCPLDNKPVDLKLLKYNAEKLQEVQITISNKMNVIRKCNAKLDSEVNRLNLDDVVRDSITTIAHQKGVLLLLKRETLFERIYRTVLALKLWQPSENCHHGRKNPCFTANGFSCSYDDHLSEIRTYAPYNLGIPKVRFM